MTDEIEDIARAFHEEYERRAGEHGWETQARSRTSWEELPAENRTLMLAVVTALVRRGVVILPGGGSGVSPTAGGKMNALSEAFERAGRAALESAAALEEFGQHFHAELVASHIPPELLSDPEFKRRVLTALAQPDALSLGGCMIEVAAEMEQERAARGSTEGPQPGQDNENDATEET